MITPEQPRVRLSRLADRISKLILTDAPPVVIANEIGKLLVGAHDAYGDVVANELRSIADELRQKPDPPEEEAP